MKGIALGCHIRNRKVNGSTYVVLDRSPDHLEVRCLESGVPARVRVADLDRWRVVWSPELTGPGLEGLRREDEWLVRVDA